MNRSTWVTLTGAFSNAVLNIQISTISVVAEPDPLVPHSGKIGAMVQFIYGGHITVRETHEDVMRLIGDAEGRT